MANEKDEELVSAAQKLKQAFPDDFSDALSLQLVAFRSVLLEDIKSIKTMSELAELLIVKYSCIASSYPEVCKALLLFLTILVTISAERSFSKLKIIKNYLRNTARKA